MKCVLWHIHATKKMCYCLHASSDRPAEKLCLTHCVHMKFLSVLLEPSRQWPLSKVRPQFEGCGHLCTFVCILDITRETVSACWRVTHCGLEGNRKDINRKAKTEETCDWIKEGSVLLVFLWKRLAALTVRVRIRLWAGHKLTKANS